MVPSWLQLLALGVLVGGFELQVRVVEEPHLTRQHGAAYTGYIARVGRFLPRVRFVDRVANGDNPGRP